MKKIITIILSFFWIFGYTQLDTDHWFAPMSASAGTSNLESNLYLSTNETTPFSVQIFNNNTLYTTVQISKGNPAQVNIPGNFMMAVSQSELFTPVAKGINVKGPKKFFANYRFAITNHAEIITSKGLAGLGKTFYAAMAANTGAADYVNATIGITATEDNTTVTVSGYNPAVVFSDGTSSPTKTAVLNKGQSYILDAISQDAPANMNGLIGAKIVADKQISVTNGNFNGIYTSQNLTNNDILMDQSVPVERLGSNFVVVRGNGPISSGMETVLIVATQDNTQITVNGIPTGTTLNTGQYTYIPGSSYINQGNLHYNVSIQTSKNAYVYQLLAGTSDGNVYPSGGFNYIPPLSCFLPNKIDEIGFINQLGGTTYNTKLNIITQTGAVVTVNGAGIPAANGPYPVNGNPAWVTYSVPNVTGNITVNSTKSVTAGIAAGSGAVGYGGYFAGFSSVPVIVKTGDCYLGVLLLVDNSYDSYQWYLNGNPIPGATTFSINPELYGAGSYTCLITKTNCESKLTDPYIYTLCPPITTTVYNIGSCNTKVITPAFTNSTQAIVPSSTAIILQPLNGTATVNSTTGQITYTPNPGLTADATDTFIYYIEGNGNPAAFEYFRINLNIDVLQVQAVAIASCANADGGGVFDLTSVSVSPDAGTTATYYTDVALTNQITDPTTYTSAAGTVYVNVTSSFGCSKPTTIQLTVNPSPNINTANYNASICDDNLDGIIPVDFSLITPVIINNAPSFTVRYYLNQADANAGNNNTLPNNWSYTANTTVYVRVDSTIGSCPTVFGQINFQIAPKIALLTTEATTSVCDNNLDGSETVDLNSYKPLFTADPAVTLTFYNTLANAQNATAPIASSQIITATGGIFYIRFQSANACANVAKLTITLKSPQMSLVLVDQTICSNSTTVLDAGTGFDAYLWSTGATTQTITVGPGNYFVDLSFNGCVYRQMVTVTGVAAPNLTVTNFNSSLCDDNFDGIVQVNFSNITPQIVANSANFNVRYYLNAADAAAGNNNTLPNNWSYTAATTVYVRVDGLSGNCPPVSGQINFTVGNKIPLITANGTADVCDNDLSGSEAVNLNSFKNLFTADPGVTLTFYTTLANAQTGTGAVPANQTITATGTFYIRFESASGCPNTAKLTITVKSPKASTTLADQTICATELTVLDAGPGFSSYLWSNGATTQSISVGVGSYWVDLGFNGCIYRQTVNVLAAPSPVITSIDLNGLTATINVSGGTPPYQYSLDGVTYQLSNVFTGLSMGIHTVYVISAENCEAVKKEFLIFNIINAITPNGDGINDVLDYSDLRVKKDVTIQIYDRYGSPIYASKKGIYIWDGKIGGRPLNTGTYWYLLKWTEPDTQLLVSYSGWILIKNRE